MKTSLSNWLDEQRADGEISDIINALGRSAVEISNIIRKAPLSGQTGGTDEVNVQGETQKQLDIITNNIVVEELAKQPAVAAMISEEIDDVIIGENSRDDARLVVCFDPLDGSSNIDTNGTIGTIFSVLELPSRSGTVEVSEILAAISNQRSAGYFLYGPATLFMLGVGTSIALFALDDGTGEFYLVEDHITVPQDTNEFSINTSYQRFWDPAVSRYIDECMAGAEGPRGKNFNMRWAGSMVADVHRVFMHGGIFIYPSLAKPGSENGKLRFLYEANPMAMLIENAGGSAISDGIWMGDIKASGLHQRVPLALGSKNEVEYLKKLYG